MKKLALLIIFVFVMLIPLPTCADEDIKIIIEQELTLFDFSEWDTASYGVDFDPKSLVSDFILDNAKSDADGIVNSIINAIKSAVIGKLPLAVMLIVCSVTAGICNAVIADEKSQLKEIIAFMSCVMCIGIITSVICSMITNALDVIGKLCAFSEGAVPLLSFAMIATGKSATEKVFSPLMAFLTGGINSIIRNTVFPLIILCFVLAVTVSVVGKGKLNSFFDLIKSALKWICGIITTVFLGIVTVLGIGAKVHDTLTMKTTKYVLDKAVPFAGNFISGTADTVLECFNAIKTASGAVFIIIAVLIVAGALLDILCTSFVLKIAAAASAPVADARLPELMNVVADVTKFLFAAVIMIDAMFIVCVGLCFVILS